MPASPKLRPCATLNWKPPVVSRVSRLTPISLTSARLTSAILTCRFTCSGVAVFSRLTTCVPSPTNAWTRRSASAESSGPATVPVSSTRPFIGVEVIAASGNARRSIWSSELLLLPTRTLVE